MEYNSNIFHKTYNKGGVQSIGIILHMGYRLLLQLIIQFNNLKIMDRYQLFILNYP